jgi:hypothetical protein
MKLSMYVCMYVSILEPGFTAVTPLLAVSIRYGGWAGAMTSYVNKYGSVVNDLTS